MDELESFREQWKAEVFARAKTESGNKDPQSSTPGATRPSRRPLAAPRIPTEKETKPSENLDFDPQSYHDLGTLSGGTYHGESFKKEPRSALEHYEKAVERENQGSLGESLDLYRKAVRMDDRVDLKYKSKHFPPSYFASKPPIPNPPNTSATVPNTGHHSLDRTPRSIKDLISGFSSLKIKPAPPAVEGTPAPPCPIAKLPDEILVQVFKETAILDVASFARLAQVCKWMAYLVSTEEQVWKRVCQGSEVGFGAMHYQWQREILGGPLVDDFLDLKEEQEVSGFARPPLRENITDTLLDQVYTSSWHQMFRLRPRIRFNGCYISTNNYIRPGQASPAQVSWNSPIHVVTYYRYLRFFRDGTVISLLTTTEPAEVVHHLTKELMETHRNKANSHLPSSFMASAFRGRWRLSPVDENPDVDLKDAEGDLVVETEGVGERYMYRMDLSLSSAGRGAKNNKLVWGGFWSYNKLTDDWAEFTRRNEKSLFWSRVKSYGMGA